MKELKFNKMTGTYLTKKQIESDKQKLHKFLQYLSDEDELVGNRTHQQIIDDFTTPANRFRLAK